MVKKLYKSYFYVFLIIINFIIVSCKSTDFVSEMPINSKNEVDNITSFTMSDLELDKFLKSHDLSIPSNGEPWSSELLVMIGLYSNKDLKVIRAEYGIKAAEIQIIAAGYPKVINPSIEYHTLGKPFTLGLSIEIPNQKLSAKELKIDIAKIDSKNSLLDLIYPAWDIRSKILLCLIEVLRFEADILNLDSINKKLYSNLKIAENNYEKGITPFTELSEHKKLLETNKNDIFLAKSNVKASKIKLASILSVPANLILPINFTYNYEKLFAYKVNEEVYKNNINHALLNRPDIIKSLSNYARVEAELRLIVVENNNKTVFFKPALLWDQTDLIFSLAGAFIPNNLSINAKVEKYMAKRDLYKAMFIANQSLALNQIQINYANLIITESQYLSAVSKFKFSELQFQIMKKRQNSGDASFLDTQLEELNVLNAYRDMENAKYDKLQSILELEKVLGHDLISFEGLPETAFMPINYILNNIKVNDK